MVIVQIDEMTDCRKASNDHIHLEDVFLQAVPLVGEHFEIDEIGYTVTTVLHAYDTKAKQHRIYVRIR